MSKVDQSQNAWVCDRLGHAIRRVYSPRDIETAPKNYDKIYPHNAPHTVVYLSDPPKKKKT